MLHWIDRIERATLSSGTDRIGEGEVEEGWDREALVAAAP